MDIGWTEEDSKNLDPDVEHRFIVLAENYRCYDMWCKSKSLNPHNRRQVVYVTSGRHLRGYKPDSITVVLVCEWWKALSNVGMAAISDSLQMYEALGTRIVKDICR